VYVSKGRCGSLNIANLVMNLAEAEDVVLDGANCTNSAEGTYPCIEKLSSERKLSVELEFPRLKRTRIWNIVSQMNKTFARIFRYSRARHTPLVACLGFSRSCKIGVERRKTGKGVCNALSYYI